MDIDRLTEDEKEEIRAKLLQDENAVPAVSVPMIRVKLSCGLEAELEEDCMDDQELLDDLIAFDKNHALYTNVLRRLLSPGDMERLYECCRVRGKVRASKVVEAMTELITQLKNGKKS